MLIENAPVSFPEDIINYGVINLLKKITKACMLQDANPPDRLLEPKKLQDFIEALCSRYGGDKRN